MTVAYEPNVKLSEISKKMLAQLSVKTILSRRALTKDRVIFITTMREIMINGH